MNKRKEENPIEYNYLEKHCPELVIKHFGPSSFLRYFKSFFTYTNDRIEIEFEEFYTDAEKLRDDIVSYIQNEMHLTCETVDFNHYIIDGKQYILNVTHGISTPTGALMGQSTVLYREKI
jgi:hypothetical protein